MRDDLIPAAKETNSTRDSKGKAADKNLFVVFVRNSSPKNQTPHCSSNNLNPKKGCFETIYAEVMLSDFLSQGFAINALELS